jgi:uncharacterized protein
VNLRLLNGAYAVCRLGAHEPLPAWFSFDAPLAVAVRRGDELSLICDRAVVPPGVVAEGPWSALEVEGPLDLSLTGVMAELATVLAEAGISILPLATYDTDLLLVRADRLDAAAGALRDAGHTLSP